MLPNSFILYLQCAVSKTLRNDVAMSVLHVSVPLSVFTRGHRSGHWPVTNCFSLITGIRLVACRWPDDIVHSSEHGQGQCLLEGCLPSPSQSSASIRRPWASLLLWKHNRHMHPDLLKMPKLVSMFRPFSSAILRFTLLVSITLTTSSINTWTNLLVSLKSPGRKLGLCIAAPEDCLSVR